jgi:hypothetical protein
MIKRLLVVAVALLSMLPAALAAEPVDLLLVLSADISRSIDTAKFQLQRDGYAAALSNPRVIQAITSGPLGKIAICFVEWSGSTAQKLVIDWAVIDSEKAAKNFAAAVVEAPRAFADRTSIAGGIDFAMAQLERSPYTAERRIIDVSGDGTNNSGRDVRQARDEALAKGVTINGIVILTQNPMPWNPEHTNPPGGLRKYYENNVTGGQYSFAMEAEGFETFGKAMTQKLIAEIAGRMPEQRSASLGHDFSPAD